VTLTVEIWSDVVCPWCYIGEHRFGTALDRLAPQADVEVVWRAFQLDPRAPLRAEPVVEAYARKLGGPDAAARAIARVSDAASGEGLEIHLDRARRANTFDAHRLLAWAHAHGRQATLATELFRAYFVAGLSVADHDVLVDLATTAGLPREEAADLLDGDDFTDAVRADLEMARELGITAVPSFRFPGGFVLPGAQDPAVFERILHKVLARDGG